MTSWLLALIVAVFIAYRVGYDDGKDDRWRRYDKARRRRNRRRSAPPVTQLANRPKLAAVPPRTYDNDGRPLPAA